MKILILSWRDIRHPLAGGAEISLMEHAKYWRENGAEVIWFASRFKNAKKSETIDGIKILRRGSHYTVHLIFILNYFRGTMRGNDIIIDSFHFIPFFTPLYIKNKKILALINEPAKNVWFKNIFFPLNFIGYLIEPLFFLPYRKTPFITSANSVALELRKNYNISKKNITIIHHGANLLKTKEIVSREIVPTVIYASRISRDKGIEDAIRAMAIIKSKIPNIQFWIIGKAESNKYLDKIKEMMLKYSINERTTFFGFVSENKKFELFARAWVLIHPSIREGWGLNVIEANSVGTPAVGYNVSGLRDSINKNTGILTSNNTYEDLAESVVRIVKNDKLRARLSNNSRIWSRKFSWEKAGKKSWSIIKKVYEKK